ncbi:C6 zinc finger domain protein [Aspergillus heteromorphus CBS 117.55]|uniref:C6 zinc finger domain protein n=1 Tax=Aspergillus heteromorphus CBS 117.55 TaxID=1448321 RepID=A0A317WIR9_9EURO|nr:C6 zinc finger domain protein [Aspergillus heteromorphus CBS 117.55]PWY84948.1 C6 zinc finger domain protein [Aspergillus heteromorphus CBS 117.55]
MVLEEPQPQPYGNTTSGVTAVTQSKPASARPTVVRKKFAKPPVKVACLACRASRTRCDGQDPCTNVGLLSSFIAVLGFIVFCNVCNLSRGFFSLFPFFRFVFKSLFHWPVHRHCSCLLFEPHCPSPAVQPSGVYDRTCADVVAVSKCLGKKKKCSYLPSKRGGPRKKKKTSIAADALVQPDDVHNPTVPLVSSGFDESSGMFGQIDVLSIPGAGLRSLDFPPGVQAMFPALFVPNGEHNAHVQMEPTPSPSNIPSQSLVRTYESDPAILNAYYDFIHHYFPIFPPRVTPPTPDQPLDCIGSFTESPSEKPILAFSSQSPLSLALSAILALIPHPNDPEPSGPASVIRRRTYAQTFAQLANASIESDCELHASSTDPAEALSSERPLLDRKPIHSRTPVELECVLALLVLSIYEYTQRGNLLKMRYRAGQALAIALDMSLHALGDEYDDFAEARRRAWWMTYYCVLQGSIVSTTPLSIVANDPQFVTPYPRFSADPDGWSVLIQAQQVLVSATQFVIDLNKCISTRTNMHYIYERMQQLDAWASSALARSNLLPIVPQSVACGAEIEFTTAQSIRAISRIKLSSAQIKVHRFRAFSDIPIFIKKHCDLTAASTTNVIANDPSKTSRTEDGIVNIGCSCSLEPFQPSSSEYTPSASSGAASDFQSMSQFSFTSGFPYSSQHSAKMCLRASLLISRMFHCLPLPQPILKTQQGLHHMLPNQLPRTMPSFACCLMQGSYAMLMIFYKARVENQMPPDSYGNNNTKTNTNNSNPTPSDRLIEEIRQGLERIITTVTNYAIAFEALDGMRDEIEGAYHTAFPRVQAQVQVPAQVQA